MSETGASGAWPDGGIVRSVQDGVAYGWLVCEVCGDLGREVCPDCWEPVWHAQDGPPTDPAAWCEADGHDEEVERCRAHASGEGRAHG